MPVTVSPVSHILLGVSAPPALPWSIEPFGPALRDALAARGMSFRDLESRSLVPVGNLHDHVSGKRGVPGDDLMRRIASGVGVEPAYFREWRERRLVEALREVPALELELSRRVAEGRLGWPHHSDPPPV